MKPDISRKIILFSKTVIAKGHFFGLFDTLNIRALQTKLVSFSDGVWWYDPTQHTKFCGPKYSEWRCFKPKHLAPYVINQTSKYITYCKSQKCKHLQQLCLIWRLQVSIFPNLVKENWLWQLEEVFRQKTRTTSLHQIRSASNFPIVWKQLPGAVC